MSQVFITYAHTDRAEVQRIAEALELAGLSVWDDTKIVSGETYREALQRELDSASCIVAVWSGAAAKSQFVRDEIHLAIQGWATNRLLLATPDDAPLPLGLRDLEPIPIGRGSRSAEQQLVQRAEAIVLQTPNLSQSAQSVTGFQVFVSYSHEDLSTVDGLVQQIEGSGYAVWIDRLATGSRRYAGQIVQAIRTSKLVAVMGSKNAYSSDHVTREVYVAGDLRKPFIAFQLDQSDIPDEILYFVTGFPRVPIKGVSSQQLRSEIARLIVA
jgi:TIR domain